MTLKILLIFSLYLISEGGGASTEVTGFSGGRVLIKWKYDKQYKSNKKYFCKYSLLKCNEQIKTAVKNEWIDEGRFSLYDNTSAAELWVLIRELTVNDTGRYECAADISFRPDKSVRLELTINEDRHYAKNISVNGLVGQSVNISCKYPQSLRRKPKFFCRRVGTTPCAYKNSVTGRGEWSSAGKLSLHDNTADGIFTVSISSLTQRDSGKYWCGAESDWESKKGYKVYFTQVNLSVTEQDQPVKPSPLPSTSSNTWRTGITSSSTSTSTPTPTSSCKTSTALPQPSPSTSSPTSNPTTLQTSTTTSSSFSTIVIPAVAVVLLVLLIGLLFFVFFLRKRKSSQDQSLRESSDSRRVSHTVYDYEEIKDTRRLPSSTTGASTVYCTAQRPTTASSDPSYTLYDNVQIRTGLRDFPNVIYSKAQLPSNLPEQNTYSTPQLPINPSVSPVRDAKNSTVKPSEDPAYATVKFTKKDAVTTATDNKEDNSCDYATVK